MIKYEITIKEKGNPNILHTSYTGQKMTEEQLVDFFGLDEPDVEWYEIKDTSEK